MKNKYKFQSSTLQGSNCFLVKCQIIAVPKNFQCSHEEVFGDVLKKEIRWEWVKDGGKDNNLLKGRCEKELNVCNV